MSASKLGVEVGSHNLYEDDPDQVKLDQKFVLFKWEYEESKKQSLFSSIVKPQLWDLSSIEKNLVNNSFN